MRGHRSFTALPHDELPGMRLGLRKSGAVFRPGFAAILLPLASLRRAIETRRVGPQGRDGSCAAMDLTQSLTSSSGSRIVVPRSHHLQQVDATNQGAAWNAVKTAISTLEPIELSSADAEGASIIGSVDFEAVPCCRTGFESILAVPFSQREDGVETQLSKYICSRTAFIRPCWSGVSFTEV